MNDAQYREINAIGNMMLGMNFNHRIPKDVRDMLVDRSKRIDAILEEIDETTAGKEPS